MKAPLSLWIQSFLTMVALGGNAQQSFDIQGHRGSRGLMPENTIPAFLKAMDLGVTTLEMDVVVSADGQVILSHEPWMSDVICSKPDGSPVLKKEAKQLNLYKMNYADIQKYDCGQRIHPDFPSQQKINAIKPTLKMIVRSVTQYAKDNHYTLPSYNIEIKSSPKGYDVFTPSPVVFTSTVVNEIRRLGIENQTTIQSFDINVLEELYKVSSRQYRISYLVEKGNITKNLSKLNFIPDIYSPYYKLLKKQDVAALHEKGIKVIPWTVNTAEDIKPLVDMGVDGLITDYPDLFSTWKIEPSKE